MMWYDKPLSEVARAATPGRGCPEKVASKPDSKDEWEGVGTAEQGSRLRKQLRHRPLGESNRALLRTYKVLATRAQKAQWVWERQCPDHRGWKG